eukprot:12233206-Alexandrium_andersonii.AAC.1
MTRRDYVLVTPALIPAIESVRALHGCGYDVHLPLEVGVRVFRPRPEMQLVAPDPHVAPKALTQRGWREAIE